MKQVKKLQELMEKVRNGEMATKHIFAGGTRVASVRSH